MNIFINILKIIGMAIGAVLIILLMIFLPQMLLEDKIPKSDIDEGKYILNLLAEEYEVLLRQRRELLRLETERLLSEKGITKTLLEKQIIERKLSEIEAQRRLLNKEYNITLNERKKIESTVSNLQQNLESSNSQIIQLNEKYLSLTIEKEKQEKYWKKFINDIKNFLQSKNYDNPKKIKEIKNGFSTDNGKEYIFTELNNLNNSILRLQNQVQLQRQNINSLKSSDFDTSKKNQELQNKIEEYKNLLGNYEKYAETIKEFDKLNQHYNLAENYYDKKNYTNSANEFKIVIQQIDQINNSYEKLIKIQKDLDNTKASSIYEKALLNIKNKKFNFALTQLQTIIKETPNSDYTDDALRSILSITNQITDKDKIQAQNVSARSLISKGDIEYQNNRYNSALNYYYDVILDNQYSNYTDLAINKIIKTNKIMMKNKIDNYGNELKNTFSIDYKLYEDYYNKGYYEKARNYYFEVLNKIFGDYSNNTILSFKKFEDNYIELLIENYKNEIEARLKN